jgi:hypothetical protein
MVFVLSNGCLRSRQLHVYTAAIGNDVWYLSVLSRIKCMEDNREDHLSARYFESETSESGHHNRMYIPPRLPALKLVEL